MLLFKIYPLKVKLVFLLAYSPKLNLIERLWGYFKKTVPHNKYYEKFSEFKNSWVNFFKKQDKYLGEISNLMGEGLAAFNTG